MSAARYGSLPWQCAAFFCAQADGRLSSVTALGLAASCCTAPRATTATRLAAGAALSGRRIAQQLPALAQKRAILRRRARRGVSWSADSGTQRVSGAPARWQGG